MPFSRTTPFRCLTVLFLALAWMVATNHCALALIAEENGHPAENHCPNCEKEADSRKPQPASSTAELSCCKVFKSLAETSATLVKAPLLDLGLDHPLLAGGIDFCIFSVELSPFTHGPPGETSFVSVDLLRCHPGNAPPFLS